MVMNKKKVAVNDEYTISYYDNENYDKKTLVFVHGWAADKDNLKCVYQPLLDAYRIISVDLPGFGESTQPGEVVGSIEYAFVLQRFFSVIRIRDIHYIGHSFGGKIGIVLAATYPDLIKRLVLIDSSGLRARRYIDWYLKVWFYKTLKFIYLHLFKSERGVEFLKKRFGSDDYKTAGSMRGILVKTVQEDFSDLLCKIVCPVFLYWGEKDKATPLWMAKKMEKEIKDAALYVVKNGTHFSFVEDNRIISIIKAFVD